MFTHEIDPILGEVGGMYLWWYGLSYTLGFLNLYVYLARHHERLRLAVREVYTLTLMFAGGVLLGGRAVEVGFDEWPFYRENLALIPALWLGGMATHGLLIGATAGTWLFSRACRKPFRELADALVVPGAFLMAAGRIGNFIDGQIVGGVTDAWWGVKFPDAEGFRHPVVLYDGLKNLLLAPYLAHVRRTNATPGATAARFVFWYAFLRIFIDLFRDYPTHRLALGTGQTLNILMTLLGLVLLARSRMRRLGRLSSQRTPPAPADTSGLPSVMQRLALAALLLFCLTIPSNWTQDVPARYSKRHAGLQYSLLYPRIDTAPKNRAGQVPPAGPQCATQSRQSAIINRQSRQSAIHQSTIASISNPQSTIRNSRV